MKRVQVAVIGGGAAGLMAAVKAAKMGAKVLLLEGNPRPGKKLLATGNGRCNLTNLHISPEHYHGDVEEAAALLARYPAEKIMAEFETLGLLCRADSEGRVYPNSLQAAAVLQVLWSACEEAGVEMCCDFPVSDLKREQDGFSIANTAGETIVAQRCILASGGKASPKHSKGNGYSLAKNLGHTVTPLVPALVPLKTPMKLCRSLKGIRCKAKAALYGDSKKLGEESGEVLFGDNQLSGICIFNLSSLLIGEKAWEIELDLLEQWEEKRLLAYWKQLGQNRSSMAAGDLFSGLLPLRVGQELMKLTHLPTEETLANLSEKTLLRATQAAKALRIPITGPGSWENAQVTSGGVPLQEIYTNTMASKQCPGLYLAGEVLNVNGDCGGYNLHWAWLTGMAAGENAGKP